MIGYLGDSRLGAVIYNVFHFRSLALTLFVAGKLFAMPLLSLIGVILFAHASLDRVLGYGLKYGDSFNSTHLGRIGNESDKASAVVA